MRGATLVVEEFMERGSFSAIRRDVCHRCQGSETPFVDGVALAASHSRAPEPSPGALRPPGHVHEVTVRAALCRELVAGRVGGRVGVGRTQPQKRS